MDDMRIISAVFEAQAISFDFGKLSMLGAWDLVLSLRAWGEIPAHYSTPLWYLIRIEFTEVLSQVARVT
jgi:hypothetical protein